MIESKNYFYIMKISGFLNVSGLDNGVSFRRKSSHRLLFEKFRIHCEDARFEMGSFG